MNNRQIITTLLDDLNMVYWTEGTNVSRDSINIQCPFHDCGDHSNHMGIFEDSLCFSCWRCKRKGHLSFLLKVITGKDVEECADMIESISGVRDKDGVDRIAEASGSWQEESAKQKEVITSSPLPKYFEKVHEKINYPLLRKYLKRRDLSLQKIVKEGCGVCRVGKYMNRMIIPIRQYGGQISFAAADMTGTAKIPYDYPSMAINNYLYGYDNVQNILVVTEGILDAWRVGDEAVAMFGLYLTDKQKSLILEKKLDAIIFCLDGDAYWHARKEAVFFEPYIESVSTVRIPFKEDPNSLGTEEIWKRIYTEMFKEAA